MSGERRQTAQDEAYLRAWAELTPAQRAQMARRGITGPELAGRSKAEPIDFEAAERRMGYAPEPVVEDEMDALCDRVAGLTPRQAGQVLAWHRAQMDDVLKKEISLLLYRVAIYLIRPKIDFRMINWGLVYAAGLDGMIDGNKSQAQRAKETGDSRARLNYYVSEWRKVLGYSVLKWCRSDEARQAYAKRAKFTKERDALRRADFEARLAAQLASERHPEPPRLDAVGE